MDMKPLENPNLQIDFMWSFCTASKQAACAVYMHDTNFRCITVHAKDTIKSITTVDRTKLQIAAMAGMLTQLAIEQSSMCTTHTYSAIYVYQTMY